MNETKKDVTNGVIVSGVLNIPVARDAIISSSSLGGLNVNLPMIMIIQVLISNKYSFFFMLETHLISSFTGYYLCNYVDWNCVIVRACGENNTNQFCQLFPLH